MAKNRKGIDALSFIMIATVLFIDAIAWQTIFIKDPLPTPRVYFLNEGHQTSEFAVFPDSKTILVDTGNDEGFDETLNTIMPPAGGNYIDLAIISASIMQNYSGFSSLLEQYQIGAFLYNGRNDVQYSKMWTQFMALITAKHIPLVRVGAGDTIRFGNDTISILSPNSQMVRSANLDDTALTEKIMAKNLDLPLSTEPVNETGTIMIYRTAAGLHITKMP